MLVIVMVIVIVMVMVSDCLGQIGIVKSWIVDDGGPCIEFAKNVIGLKGEQDSSNCQIHTYIQSTT